MSDRFVLGIEEKQVKRFKLVTWTLNKHTKVVYDMNPGNFYSCYVGAGDMDCSKWSNGARHFAQFILK